MIKKTLTLLSFVLLSVSLFAQQKITGQVIDDAKMTLPGVNILVKGTALGTITDFDGNYSIEANAGQTLIVSFMGYETQEIVVGTNTTINVTLMVDAHVLSETVVTALGIKREKKALGYAVQDVKADELTQTGDANLVNTLQGKVAGVQINQSGTGAGGATRVDIRGISSLEGGNEPLWIVDGVPFDNGNGSDATTYGGTSRAGGAFDLNPDDIESISILKGANAAALYGERGGNGVIMVTTKKGKRNESLGINYSGGVNFSEAAYMLDLQDQYGQGSEGIYEKNGTSSWGPKMEGQMLEAWTGKTIPYSAQSDRLKDFTRIGVNQNHNISFTGGTEKGSFRASIGRNIMQGIYEEHEVGKTTMDLRADYDINSWLNVDAKVSYFLTEGQERPEIGNYSYVSYFNAMPMNVRTQDLKPGYILNADETHEEIIHKGKSDANTRNPYFLQAQTTNNDEKTRFFGYFAANLKFTDYLKAKFKYGLDTYSYQSVDGYLFGDNVDSNRPNYNTNQTSFREENLEALLSFNKKLSDDFELSLNLGANKMVRDTRNLRGMSGRLSSESDFYLGAGSNIQSEEKIIEQETRSIFGFGQLTFRNYLYLDLTARNDWSSTLTAANLDLDNSYFYPSVSLSAVISDIVDLPSWITFAKIRSSYAKIGKATSPYLTNTSYTIDSWNYSLNRGNVAQDGVSSDLRSELSTSWEVGTDLRLLNNRLGVDFTFYTEDTKHQILKIEQAHSMGIKELLTNAGLIRNRGIELMVKTVPVKTKDFRLGINFNFAKNKGTLEELQKQGEVLDGGAPVSRHDFDGGVWAFEGGMLGDIRGTSFERNGEGQLIIDNNGLPVRINNSYGTLLGNIQADWTGSVNLTADYKGIFISALVSIQQGGELISSSEQGATSAGNSTRTTANNRMSFFVDGVTAEGNPNHEMVSAEEYWRHIASIDEAFVYDASHAKLREIAIGYNLPKSLLAKIPTKPIQKVRVSFVGRNLFYLYRSTPGTAPDASAYSTEYNAQAYDFSPVPGTRTYGFSLNIGF